MALVKEGRDLRDDVQNCDLGASMLGGLIYWVRDQRKKNSSGEIDDCTFGHHEIPLIVKYVSVVFKKTIWSRYKT